MSVRESPTSTRDSTRDSARDLKRTTPVLELAQVVADTEAEGPGRRYAIWLQGCPLRCPGCCNPEMLPFGVRPTGERVTSDELARRVLATPGIEGVSLLGGEPFAQAEGAAALARTVRDAGLSVMIFSGFTREELTRRGEAGEEWVAGLLGACDLLVDGPYDRERPDTARRWIGSTNQTMHFMTDRYRPDDPRMRAKNTVEIRLRKGELIVNGWPALADATLPKHARRPQ